MACRHTQLMCMMHSASFFLYRELQVLVAQICMNASLSFDPPGDGTSYSPCRTAGLLPNCLFLLLLRSVVVAAAMPDEPVFEYFDSTWEPHIDSRAACSVAHLCKLESLTRLVINVHEEDCSDVFWHGLAELDRLRELHINELSFAHFGGVVALAKCTALTHLSINRLEEDSFPTPSPHGKHIPYFAIKVNLLTPALGVVLLQLCEKLPTVRH